MLINCRTMQGAVMLSGSLLALGVLLGIIASTTPLMAPFSQLSLLLVLAAAMLLAGIFLVALLPPVSRRMDECRH
jgi:NAD/NADP transhydrogenase beta subunit